MNNAEIRQAASDAYVRGYGDTLMEFAERHERAIAAAVAAVAPLVLAEPSDAEIYGSGEDCRWDGPDYERARRMFSNRLASVTAKPDPAVEAVKALWLQHDGNASAEQIVAAVDAARKAKP